MERDFNRKSTRVRKRHARFMEDHSAGTTPEVVSAEIAGDSTADRREPPPHPRMLSEYFRSRPQKRLPQRSRQPLGTMLLLMTRSCRFSKPTWICLICRQL